MTRRSRFAKLAAWTCLLGFLFVVATDWNGDALPPRVESLLGGPQRLAIPLACLAVSPPPSPARPSDAGRAPPLS
jgi:hypothetical protein